MNLKPLFCVWLMTLSVMSPAWADNNKTTLSLATAQQIAVNRSRQLTSDTAAVLAANEMAVFSAQHPDPVVRLGIENLPITGGDSFQFDRSAMTMQRVGVMQKFVRDDKRQLRGEWYRREADIGLAKKSESLANIQRATALAWLERYYAEAMVALMQEQLTQVAQQILAAESAYRAGKGNLADILTMRAERVSLENQLSEVNLKLTNASTNLTRWVGKAADRPLANKPPTETIAFDVHSLTTQLAKHPEIAILHKQEALADTEAKLAQATKLSDWSLEVAYSHRGSQFSDMVSFGVSVPLQLDQKNRQDRALIAKLAKADQVRARREEVQREYVAQVRNMINAWKSTKERQSRIEQQLLPLAIERTTVATSAYRGGKTTLTEVLGATRNETAVKLQRIELEKEVSKLWAQLTFLLPNSVNAQSAQRVSNQEAI